MYCLMPEYLLYLLSSLVDFKLQCISKTVYFAKLLLSGIWDSRKEVIFDSLHISAFSRADKVQQ